MKRSIILFVVLLALHGIRVDASDSSWPTRFSVASEPTHESGPLIRPTAFDVPIREWSSDTLFLVQPSDAAVGAQPSESQNRPILSGYVAGAATGDALEGVNVYLPGPDVGTVTDQNGFYRLPVPDGRLNVRFSFIGYRTRTVEISVNGDTRLDVEMELETILLEEVEVTDARDEEMLGERMGTVRLPIEEVERLPAFLGEVDIIKTIQLLPGVQSGTEGSTGLYVRGGGPDQNAVLLDGAPVYNPSHVFGFLSVFNTSALDDVELIKGGFPARYGGRLSSVIDIFTRPGDLQSYGAEGNVGLVFSSLTLEGPLVEDRASFLVSARRTYIDVLARPFVNRRLPEGSSFASYFYDTNAKLAYRFSDRNRVSLSFYLGRDVYASTVENVDRTGEPVFRDRATAASDWGNTAASLEWRRLHSPKFFSNASLSYSRYRFDVLSRLSQIEESNPPQKATEEIEFSSGIADVAAAFDATYRPNDRHTARFGVNVARHGFNPGVSSLTLQATGDANVDSTLTPNAFPFSGVEGFVYAEDAVVLSPRWHANVGIHGSAMRVNGITYSSLQPRISVRHDLSRSWNVEASFGTMQQYLHLLSNSGLNLPTDLWVAATDRIRPQRAWQSAIGVAYRPSSGDVQASVEGYYKRMDHLIEYRPGASFTVPGVDWQDKVTSGRGWSYGVELFLRKMGDRTTGWIGYTLSWSQRQFDVLNDGRPFPYRYDRRHDLSVVVSHRLSERVDIGATWVYGTGQAITLTTSRYQDGRLLDARTLAGSASWAELREFTARGGYRMAPYHRLDFVVNWSFDSVIFTDAGESTLAVGAYNVYNRRNPFYLFEARRKDGSRAYKQASLFPVLPFVSYRFRF